MVLQQELHLRIFQQIGYAQYVELEKRISLKSNFKIYINKDD